MPWDSSLPDGDISIALGDDAIRANNVAIEAALTLEHRFATGGNQSGRHVFVTDTAANIAALADVADGSIAFDTDTLGASRPVLRVYDGSTWNYAQPGDPSNPVAYVDEVNNWDGTNNFLWQSVTPGAGSPDTLAINLAESGYKYATITGDTEVQNPSNFVAGYASTVLLQITNSGAGHTLTWDNVYHSSYGIAPIFDPADGAINYFSLTRMQTGNVLVTAIPSISVIT